MSRRISCPSLGGVFPLQPVENIDTRAAGNMPEWCQCRWPVDQASGWGNSQKQINNATEVGKAWLLFIITYLCKCPLATRSMVLPITQGLLFREGTETYPTPRWLWRRLRRPIRMASQRETAPSQRGHDHDPCRNKKTRSKVSTSCANAPALWTLCQLLLCHRTRRRYNEWGAWCPYGKNQWRGR